MQKTTRFASGFNLLFISTFLVLVSYNVSAQQADKAVLWKSACSFIDSVQADDSVKSDYITSSNGLTDVYEDTGKIFRDSVFAPVDIRAFRKQLAMYRTWEWADSDKLDNIKILPQSTITSLMIKGPQGWDKLTQKCGKGYKSYSFPIFSDNSSYVILAESYHTRHKTTGGTCLFKNVKGSWKRVKTYATWSGS